MTVYDEAFFDVIRDGSRRSAEAVVPLVMAELWPIRTVLDVGCGEGWWGKAFETAGCRVTGVDGPGTACQLEKFVPLDLATQRIPRIYPVFDLVVCLEVAEHLPAESAARLVDDLCNLSSVVLFSAAIPGQGGTNHVNERWPAYWAELFEARRYRCSGALRWRIWDNPDVEPWYKQNLFVYAHDSAVQVNEAIFFGPAAGPIPVVHPAFWEDRLSWGAA